MVAGSYRGPSRSSTSALMSCSAITGGQSLSRSWALHHMLLTSVCPLTGAWVIGALMLLCPLQLPGHALRPGCIRAGDMFGGFLRGCCGPAGRWVRSPVLASLFCQAHAPYQAHAPRLCPPKAQCDGAAAAGRPPPGKKHTITHGACGAEVAHLKSVALDLALPEHAGETLTAAMQRRSVAATACNERSSRSHLVFAVAVSASSARTGQKLLGALRSAAGSDRRLRHRCPG